MMRQIQFTAEGFSNRLPFSPSSFDLFGKIIDYKCLDGSCENFLQNRDLSEIIPKEFSKNLKLIDFTQLTFRGYEKLLLNSNKNDRYFSLSLSTFLNSYFLNFESLFDLHRSGSGERLKGKIDVKVEKINNKSSLPKHILYKYNESKKLEDIILRNISDRNKIEQSLTRLVNIDKSLNRIISLSQLIIS